MPKLNWKGEEYDVYDTNSKEEPKKGQWILVLAEVDKQSREYDVTDKAGNKTGEKATAVSFADFGYAGTALNDVIGIKGNIFLKKPSARRQTIVRG